MQVFFLRNIGQENVFYDILERKNAFFAYKNKKFKKSKSWHFSKGVNPRFSSKNAHLSNFFFWQHRPRKCLLWYSRRKKRLSRLENQEVPMSKNWNFPKGLTHCFGPKMPIFLTVLFRRYIPGKCLLWYSRTKKRHSRL